MWYGIRTTVEHNQSDLLFELWAFAENRAKYAMNLDIRHELSEDKYKKLEQERMRFVEFFMAMGGLLLHENQYKILLRVFRFTLSEPPSYELLPNSMMETIDQYIYFIDPFDTYFEFIEYKYPFKDLYSLGEAYNIKKAIAKFVALLFLRLYRFRELNYNDPLIIVLPKTISKINKWRRNLASFRRDVEDLYSNSEKLNQVGLGFLNDEWCKENNRLNPHELVNKLGIDLENELQRLQRNQVVSNDKVKHYYSSSVSILTSLFRTIELFKSNTNGCSESSDSNQPFYWNGSFTLVDKDTFIDNPDVHHMNFDSFFAQHLVDKTRSLISTTLIGCATEKYIVDSFQLNMLLDKVLDPTVNYTIITYLISDSEISNFMLNNRANVRVVNFGSSWTFLNKQSIFIFRDIDLPCIKFIEPKDEDVSIYCLEKVEEKYNIYASVVDLNTNQELYENMAQSNYDFDLLKSVVLSLFFSIEWRFPVDYRYIHVQLKSPFNDEDLAINIDNIQPFSYPPKSQQPK